MKGFLRFALFFVLLVAAFVLLVLPLALSPILTQMVRDAGLRSQTLDVSVALFDPTLLLGRSRRVALAANDVDIARAQIGRIDLALEEVSFFDRSFERVFGELDDVTVNLRGDDAHVTRVKVSGPADAANAVALLSPADTEHVIQLAGADAGIDIEAVDVSGSGLTVTIDGQEANARIGVEGGALVLDPGIGVAIVLLQPAPSDDWSLTEAWISDEGLNVRGVVDVTSLTESINSE